MDSNVIRFHGMTICLFHVENYESRNARFKAILESGWLLLQHKSNMILSL
jgi:hypothetical protein